MGWINLNNQKPKEKQMVVFIAKDVEGVCSGLYTSDPYCGWIQNGQFVRWPHEFNTTHYMEIPHCE